MVLPRIRANYICCCASHVRAPVAPTLDVTPGVVPLDPLTDRPLGQRNVQLWRISPLSLLTTAAPRLDGSIPDLDACFSDDRLASFVRPRGTNSLPTIPRSQQSITPAKCDHPSPPDTMGVGSIAHHLSLLSMRLFPKLLLTRAPSSRAHKEIVLRCSSDASRDHRKARTLISRNSLLFAGSRRTAFFLRRWPIRVSHRNTSSSS